jgi:DNA repair exonuclease SbcCD ATPase subunit
MVPQKIIIEGFLCYRTRQEVDLADLRLCMLAGPNGSGKSTVFDAITFSLFGSHRGGSKNIEDLINKKCESARIIFEFLLDGSAWQIYRTIKRSARGGARCTGDVRRPSIKGEADAWDVVPDTSSADGLSNWVASKLALSGKAFTRSMLLRQGESDRLLSAEPRERFEVLAGVAELEKYQELEQSANDRRRSTEIETGQLQTQLAAVLPVSDAELEQAAMDAQNAADRVKAADASIADLHERHAQSKLWADLNIKLEQTAQKRKTAAELIKNASQIEADYRQLTSLAAALPHLSNIFDQQQRIAQSRERIQSLSGQREQKRQLLDSANAQAKTAQEACGTWEPLIPVLETQHGVLTRQIAESRRILDAADGTEKQRKALAQVEARLGKIVQIHPHPDTELKQARQEAERLTALSAALPTLERFIESRRDRSTATTRHAEADALKQKLGADAESATAQRQTAQHDLESAEAGGLDAQKNETEANALLKRAKDAMSELDRADGQPDCPTCGQPLTQSHFAQERDRRQAEIDQWTNRKAAATKVRHECEVRIKQFRRTCSDFDQRLRDLAEQIHKSLVVSTQAAEQIGRSARDCVKSYTALPDELRSRISAAPVSDWASTTWPSAEDLTQLEREAGRRDVAHEQVRELDQVCSEWQSLTTQAAAMRDALAAHQIDIPDDLPQLREAHARQEKEQRETEQRLKNARESLRREQQALKTLAAQIKSLEADIAGLSGACDVEQANQSNFDETVRRALAQLPEEWSDRAKSMSHDSLNRWKMELNDLAQRGVVEAYDQLTDARCGLSAIEERLKELQNDIDRVPHVARQQPDVVDSQLERARLDRDQHETARQHAQTRHGELQSSRHRRQELECSLRQSDRQLRHLKLLCDLLGKKRLQLYLVRQTERKIVECANHILERLSAGDLHLQLRGGDADDGEEFTDQALDLVAVHRATGGGEPIAVAFLSGSQRFRVAVSLALAIGQVAGNHRCGECVIIDEGFGSLDREGQEVMIQELQRLQGIMKRIILVSHQESFADAFGQGYRFAICDGEARVERMSS